MNKDNSSRDRRGSLQLTKKVNYAIILLIELAFSSSPVSLKDISDSKNLSFSFLQRVARELVSCSFIKSTRGKFGGYVLNRASDEINLLEIIECVDGPIYMLPCLKSNASNVCESVNGCVVKSNFDKLNCEICDYLKMFRLKDLIG